MTKSDGMKRWAVLKTKPHKEELARQQLERQGFDLYLPTQTVTVRHARRTHDRAKPFFPGYCFVVIEPQMRWRAINGTLGVDYLISAGDRPLLLPEGFVETLRDQLNAPDGAPMAGAFKPGDKARIVRGPFVDLIGKLATIDTKGRVTVLLELLDGTVPVQIPAKNIAPV